MDFFGCRNLNKKFGEEEVLVDCSLSFPSSGIVSITGPSGCGKSTLLSCLLGLDECEGEIYFKNRKIEDFSYFRNKYTGVIFQNFHLFEYLDVEENIKLFSKSRDYLKVVKLLGLEGKMNQKVALLSGGEKQRVAIARTLLKKPKIIFCDEITGSLDQDNAKQVMKYLKQISKDILIINISHNLELINKYSDYIVKYENKSFKLNIDGGNQEIKKLNKINLSLKDLFIHSFNLMNKSKVKIFLSSLSLMISFSLTGVVISLNRSISQYFETYKTRALDYSFIELSLNEKVKIENSSFTLIKQTRPVNLDKIMQLDNSFIPCYNYSNLINSYTSLSSGNQAINLSFYPCEDESITSYREVIVNKAAYKLLKNKTIQYKNNRSINYIGKNNQEIGDTLKLEMLLKVVKVNEEMPFLQEPAIYYSYDAMHSFFQNIYLKNLSAYFGKAITLSERIGTYYFEGDFFNTGSIYLYQKDKSKIASSRDKINRLKQDKYTYSFTNRSLDTFDNYQKLLDSIIKVVEIFIALSFITSFSLLILCINSLIIDEKKEIGIFKSLGILDRQVERIITIQVFSIVLFSLLMSMLIKFIFYTFLSEKVAFLNVLGFKNVLYENLIVSLFALGTSLIIAFVGKILVTRINIYQVLRED